MSDDPVLAAAVEALWGEDACEIDNGDIRTYGVDLEHAHILAAAVLAVCRPLIRAEVLEEAATAVGASDDINMDGNVRAGLYRSARVVRGLKDQP